MINFVEYYKHKGHVFGQCMSGPDIDLMYINIPKNASTWIKSVLENLNWEYYNYHTDHLNKPSIVVLKDPIERWLSGISEYMYLYHSNIDITNLSESFFDIIFDRISFDDHTEKQILFLENVDLNTCTFFHSNNTLKNKIGQFLNQDFNNYPDKHVTKDDPARSKFRELFLHALNNNSKYKHQLESYYETDYNLINSVKFYAG